MSLIRRMKAKLTPLALMCLALTMAGCATPSQMVVDAQVRELCAKDGGVRVYETVVLPPEKFDKWGLINIREKSLASPNDDFYYVREQVYIRVDEPTLMRSEHKIIRRIDEKVLGVSIRYGRGGGDIPGPWYPSTFACPEISKDQPQLETSVFLKGASK